MTMFPVDWEEALSIDHLPKECPYGPAEIEDYLHRCHYHLMQDEEPTEFDVSGPHAHRQEIERRFWLFEARDKKWRRQWYVLVGTGKSFSNPSEKMRRWMYAKTNDDDVSADQFLNEECREQLAADARLR